MRNLGSLLQTRITLLLPFILYPLLFYWMLEECQGCSLADTLRWDKTQVWENQLLKVLINLEHKWLSR